MDRIFKILGFAGSLRKNSFNRALLRVAQGLVPQGASLEIFDLEGIPLYNQELEENMPQRVKDFKNSIRNSDAILVATPEYNRSIPGVLKNAIDWASRPPQDNSFTGKPVALISASTGMLGGAMAQYHLRQTFVFLNMYPINRPEVYISFAHQKFDAAGNFTDEKGKQFIHELLQALVDWTKRLAP